MSDSRVSRLLMMALGLCLCGALTAAQNLEVEKPKPGAKPAPASPAATQAKPPAPEKPAPGRRNPRRVRPPPRRRRRSAEGGVREVHAAERPAGDPARRSEAADRPREPVVPRRLEERADGPHRLRAPLRAHDVPGLEERQRGLLQLRRDAPARTCRKAASTARPASDRTNYFATVPSGNLETHPLARVRPPGDAARRD